MNAKTQKAIAACVVTLSFLFFAPAAMAQPVQVSGRCITGTINLSVDPGSPLNGKVWYSGTGTVLGFPGVAVNISWDNGVNKWYLDFDGQAYFENADNTTLPPSTNAGSWIPTTDNMNCLTGAPLSITGSGTGDREINVKQNTTNIADGGSFDFGNITLGSNDNKTFTIENTGTITLNLTGTPPNFVIKGGTNPGDFAITQPATGTISAGSNTTFTVVFTPGGPGARSCTLQIPNNDGNENPYDITLNGMGVCSPPACNLIGADFVCSNSPGNIYTAPAGMSAYNWSISGAGAIPGSTTGQSVSVTSGNYLNTYTVSVTVTDANGCTSSCSKLSSIFLLSPPANITVNPNPACFGVTLDLSISASASSTVAWTGEGITNPSGNPSTTAIPASPGVKTYSVMVTADNGCSNTDEVMVTVNSSPTTPTITGPTSVCSGGGITLDAGAGYSGYAWSNGGGGGQTATFNNITSPATYTVTVTGANGCTSTDTHAVAVSTCNIEFSGKIKFSNNTTLGVNNALVSLTGSATGSDLTDTNGDFFISTSASSGNFTLKPTKTANKLNGVTVADATAVQQHAANITLITDLYKQVAADVNKSNSITTTDASIINQALLGNPTALTQFNTSWRFVPTNHTMSTPPWGFPEQRTYTGISGPQTNQDFYGIKTGDVVTTYANPANVSGNNAPLTLTLKNENLTAGTEFTAEFKAAQTDDLAALQMAVRFDPAQLQFMEAQPATALPLTMDNFGAYNIAAGEIRVAWSQATGVAVSEAAPVFRLKFTALQSGVKLSEALQLDESELPALAYPSTLVESKVKLTFAEVTGTADPTAAGGVQLLQNRPNPFNGQTAIGFVLPESCEAQLRVLDVSGRVLAEKKVRYAAGRHEETFDLGGASGVFWYELTTPFGVLAKKMVAVGR